MTAGQPAAGSEAWPPRRRSAVLPVMLGTMLMVAAGSGSYMLWHRRLPPDPDGGLRCSRAFDAPLDRARGGSDADLLGLSDAALASGCGRHAYEAADLVGPEATRRLCASDGAAHDAALARRCAR